MANLSEILSLNERDISQAINHGGKTNFCDYINGLRIAHFIELSRTSLPDNILQMALASGFSSKSSFNTVFKKLIHTTPSQYLKENSLK